MQKILNKLSKKLNLSIEELEKIYKSYWKFIRQTIEGLPLKEDLKEEDFNKIKTNFNIVNIGKLSCTYPRYKVLKEHNKRREDAKHKESQTNG